MKATTFSYMMEATGAIILRSTEDTVYGMSGLDHFCFYDDGASSILLYTDSVRTSAYRGRHSIQAFFNTHKRAFNSLIDEVSKESNKRDT